MFVKKSSTEKKNMERKKIKSKSKAVVTGRRYGPTIEPPAQLYSSDGTVLIMTHLHTCTNESCGKVEQKEREFLKCGRCHTKYCSKKCHINDHINGGHKLFCKYEAYKVQRDLFYKKWFKEHNQEPNFIFGDFSNIEKEWLKVGKKYKQAIPKDYISIYQNYY